MKSMRNEIVGIFLFFLVILTLVSLLSYSPADPSLNHVGPAGPADNFFGLLGAYLASLLIGLFGLGSFWIPVLLFIACIQFFKNPSSRYVMMTAGGGLVLIIVTGSLFAIYAPIYEILGSRYTAGGLIGYPIRSFLLAYSNTAGATVILAVFFIIGFILTTGVSFIGLLKNAWRLLLLAAARMKERWVRFRDGRKERKKRKQAEAPVRKPAGKAARKKKPQPAANALPPSSGEAPFNITIKSPPAAKPNRSSVPAPKQQVFESMRFAGGFQQIGRAHV